MNIATAASNLIAKCRFSGRITIAAACLTLFGCGSREMTIDYRPTTAPSTSNLAERQFRLNIDDRSGQLLRAGPGVTQYITTKLTEPKSEVVTRALSEAISRYSARMNPESETELRVTIEQFQGFVSQAGFGLEGLVTVALRGHVARDGKSDIRIHEAVAQEAVALGPFTLPWESLKPLFEGCLSRAVDELLADLNYAMGRNELDDPESPSAGTCFAISPDGWIVTADHVIGDNDTIDVMIGSVTVPATVAARDVIHDLALLRVQIPTPDFLTIQQREAYDIGTEVYALGYPLRGVLTNDIRFTDGTISSLSGVSEDDGKFQISVPVQPGNSGGPLLSKDGRVLGAIISRAADLAILYQSGSLPENISFAVRAEHILSLLESASVSVPPPCDSTIGEAAKAVHPILTQ